MSGDTRSSSYNSTSSSSCSSSSSSSGSSPGAMKRMPMRSRSGKHAFVRNSDATLPLVFANVGLVIFVVAGIFYIKEDWDRFSLLCVLGYASIILGLLLPELLYEVDNVKTTYHPTGTRDIDDRIEKGIRERKWMQFWGSVLMIVGIFLGIAGSLLYSPTIIRTLSNKMIPLIDEANLVWAISFLIFPVGFALLTYDKLLTLQSLAEEDLEEEDVTIWHPQMRVHLWTEIFLILFAMAGVVIVSVPNALGEICGMTIFALGAFIKVCLLFYELCS
jgi:hypothetical protein